MIGQAGSSDWASKWADNPFPGSAVSGMLLWTT